MFLNNIYLYFSYNKYITDSLKAMNGLKFQNKGKYCINFN